MTKPKLRLFDGLLLLSIVGSVIYIGSKFLVDGTDTRSSEPGGTSSSFIQGSPNLSAPAGGKNVPAILDNDWERLYQDPKFRSGEIETSNTCASRKNIKDLGIVTNSEYRIAQLKEGYPQTFSGLKSPPCVSKGQTFQVITNGKVGSDKYVSFVGTTEVKSIVNLQIRDIPDLFFRLQKVSREEFLRYILEKRGSQGSQLDNDTIIRISPIANVLPGESEIPLAILGGRIISQSQVGLLVKGVPDVIFVDVRSADEFKLSPANSASQKTINIPFSFGPGVNTKFSWSKSVADIGKATFNVGRLMGAQASMFVFLDSGPGDGRAYWAASSVLPKTWQTVVLVRRDE